MTHETNSKLSAASQYLQEYLKGVDNYSSKANFRISHKVKSEDNKKRYDTSVGSIYGGILSIIMEVLFGYLFIYGVL